MRLQCNDMLDGTENQLLCFLRFTLTVEKVQGPCVKESRVGGLRPGTGDPGDLGISGNFGANNALEIELKHAPYTLFYSM